MAVIFTQGTRLAEYAVLNFIKFLLKRGIYLVHLNDLKPHTGLLHTKKKSYSLITAYGAFGSFVLDFSSPKLNNQEDLQLLVMQNLRILILTTSFLVKDPILVKN